MARLNCSTVIAIDSERSALEFYSMLGSDASTASRVTKKYDGYAFSEEFFASFKESIAELSADTPAGTVRKVSVVLPDKAIVTDVLSVPTMRMSAQTKKALEDALGGLFSNYSELRFSSALLEQNKQYSSFAISAVQKRIAASIYAACSENKLLVDTLTYASASTACGAALLDSSLKNASYLFLDVKEGYSRFVFVVGGKALGSYILPFGEEILRMPAVVSEASLFNYSFAELILRTARERAKGAEIISDGSESAERGDAQKPKKRDKNIVRAENFKIFLRRAELLLRDNSRLTSFGEPCALYINLPTEYDELIARAASEQGEGEISVKKPDFSADSRASGELELYGALFPTQISALGKL